MQTLQLDTECLLERQNKMKILSEDILQHLRWLYIILENKNDMNWHTMDIAERTRMIDEMLLRFKRTFCYDKQEL